jgi:ABC-type enterochelin transport system ATPase subunit
LLTAIYQVPVRVEEVGGRRIGIYYE